MGDRTRLLTYDALGRRYHARPSAFLSEVAENELAALDFDLACLKVGLDEQERAQGEAGSLSRGSRAHRPGRHWETERRRTRLRPGSHHPQAMKGVH